mgnify:CR=1 FL=1
MGETTNETDLPAAEPEAMRQEVRALQEREGLSLADIAKAAGIPYGTFTPFMTGKYAGNNEALAGRVKRWLDSRISQRRHQSALPKAPGFIATPTAVLFMTSLEHAQAAPDIAVISGGAGVGKTSAICEYRRTAPNVWVITARPSLCTVQPVLEELLAVLAITERAPSRRTASIIRRVEGTGGLIVVDEAQHLRTEALEELRSIHDASGVGIALVGNESVYSKLDGNGRSPEFAQLFRRIGLRTRRKQAATQDIAALADAWGVAGAAERRLLHTIAKKPGALGGLTKVMRLAHMLALGEADGEPPLVTEGHIARAWSRISDQPAEAIAVAHGAERGGN